MPTVSTNFGSVNAIAAATTLAAANYDLTATTNNAAIYNSTTNKPSDTVYEYAATAGAAPTGNKQIVLFVQASLDGVTWGAVPTSATDTTHDLSMRFLGAITIAAAESVRDRFSIAAVFGGALPAYWRVIPKNDCGVALSACAARTQEISISAA